MLKNVHFETFKVIDFRRAVVDDRNVMRACTRYGNLLTYISSLYKGA